MNNDNNSIGQGSNYRKSIISSLCLCQKAISEIRNDCFNMGLRGTLQKLYPIFKTDEEVPIDLTLLKLIDDVTVRRLLSVVDRLERISERLKLANSVSDEEVREALANFTWTYSCCAEGEISGYIADRELVDYATLLRSTSDRLAFYSLEFYGQAGKLSNPEGLIQRLLALHPKDETEGTPQAGESQKPRFPLADRNVLELKQASLLLFYAAKYSRR